VTAPQTATLYIDDVERGSMPVPIGGVTFEMFGVELTPGSQHNVTIIVRPTDD
jgi:hypothetical protein